MIGDMLEGRTKDGPRLIFGWMHSETGQVHFLCVKPDGLIESVPMAALSVDWHHDSKDGWQRDFQGEE